MGSLNARACCASRLMSSALATEPCSPAGKIAPNFLAGPSAESISALPEGDQTAGSSPRSKSTRVDLTVAAAATRFPSPAVNKHRCADECGRIDFGRAECRERNGDGSKVERRRLFGAGLTGRKPVSCFQRLAFSVGSNAVARLRSGEGLRKSERDAPAELAAPIEV